MKVILLQDVKSLGKEGDIVNVSDGYARNFVIPKKLGVEANDKNRNDLKLKKQREAKEAALRLEEAQNLAKELEKVTVVVTMKAGEGGRVFGSVSAKEIAQEAKKQHNLELDKKKIQLAEPIKSFGSFEIPIRLHPKVAQSRLTGLLWLLQSVVGAQSPAYRTAMAAAAWSGRIGLLWLLQLLQYRRGAVPA